MEVRTVIIFRTLLCKVWRSGRWIGKSDFWNEFRYPGGVSPDGSWVWTSQTEMPWPGVVFVKSNKIQKRLKKPPPSTAETPKPLEKPILCWWGCFPSPHGPPAPPLTHAGVKSWDVLCWLPDFICIHHFPMYQHKNMLPGPNTAIKVLHAKQHISVSEASLDCFLGLISHFSVTRPFVYKAHLFFNHL